MAAAHPAPVQPPQAPYGPPPYWAPPRQRPLGPILAVVVFLVVFLVIALAMIGMFVGFGGPVDVFFPFCGVVFFLVIMAILIAVYGSQGGFGRANLPPPPPIQQPMVPAGMTGPVALTCPNCGAPPVNVDRFGVATCTYCGTRFLVR